MRLRRELKILPARKRPIERLTIERLTIERLTIERLKAENNFRSIGEKTLHGRRE